jgi:timeless
MTSRNVPIQKLTQTIDYEVNNEVLATCNSIGYFEEGKYIKEPDCNACLKDLIRFLRSDNAHTFAVRRQLGSCNLIVNDLVPIMKQHCVTDHELFDLVLRLLVSLTNPALLLFKEEMPTERDQKKIFLELIDHLFAYKQVLAYDVKFWSVVAKHMLRILNVSTDQREEDDKILFERILILLRNALHVPSQDEHEVVYGDDNVHDKLLVALKLAGMFDILLHVCQTPDEHEFCFHILEIFSLIFKEQDSELLAKHSNSIKVCDLERKNDVREMKELLARDKARLGNRSATFDRFKGSTYVVKNFKVIGDRDLICHKTISDVSEITFDADKRSQRKAKNRQHLKDNEHISNSSKRSHSSTFEVKRHLRDLCCAFLADSYNLFMKRVRYYLERSSSAENDETYYLWASDFFMQFNRNSGASCELVKETFTAEFLHYLHCLIEMHLDRVKTDKKQFAQWSKRLHYGIKAYRELLFTVAHVHSEHRYEVYEAANEIKRKIFYEQEHRELLRTLLLVYDPIKMSDGYLNDLIEANHIFLKLFEYYAKKNKTIVVNKKKKVTRRKAKPKTDKQTDALSSEQLWTELSDQVRRDLELLSGSNDDLEDEELNAFDMLSSLSKDEQKMNVMKKIVVCLRDKQSERAIKLLRTARYFFIADDDDEAFGRPGSSIEQEVQVLREMFTNELLIQDEGDNGDTNRSDDGDEPEPDEDEPAARVEYREENLEFTEFVKTYATPKIIFPFCLSLKNYEYNAMRINSYIIKMFHRLAFDCLMYAQFFQLSILRTFQQIMNKHSDNDCYTELIRFAQFVVGKLLKVVAKNDKIFVEILYWKNTREAYEVEEGYGSSKVEPVKKNGKKGRNKGKGDLSRVEVDADDDDSNEPIEIERTNVEKRSDKPKRTKNEKRKGRSNKKARTTEFGDEEFAGEQSNLSDDDAANDVGASTFDRIFGNKVDQHQSDDESDDEQVRPMHMDESPMQSDSSGQSTAKKRRRLVIADDQNDDDDDIEPIKGQEMVQDLNEEDDERMDVASTVTTAEEQSSTEDQGQTVDDTEVTEPQNEPVAPTTVDVTDDSSQESLVNQRNQRRPKATLSSDDEPED